MLVTPAVLHDGTGPQAGADRPRHGLLPPGDLRADADGVASCHLPAEGETSAACSTAGWSSQPLEDWRGYKAGDLVAYRPDELLTRRRPAGKGAAHLLFSPGPAPVDRAGGDHHGPHRRGDLRQRPRRPLHLPPERRGLDATRSPDRAQFVGRPRVDQRDRRPRSTTASRTSSRRPTSGGDAWPSARAGRAAAPATSRTCRPASTPPATTVDQYEATSSDGTKVPYFVVHPKDDEARRVQPDHPLRLRRLPGLHAASLLAADRQAVAGARRRLRAGQHPRRRRVRAGLARGGPEDPPPADLRRLRRGGEGPDRAQDHLARAGSASRAAPTAAC